MTMSSRTEERPLESPEQRRGLFARFLAAMHESRRRQAEREIRQHQHLIDQAAAYHARCEAERRRCLVSPQNRSQSPAHQVSDDRSQRPASLLLQLKAALRG